MVKHLACFLLLGCILLLAAASRASAENLPVTVDRYSEACLKVGGGIGNGLNGSGTGTLYCLWPERRDGTECKVGSYQVNICSIRCSSEACYAANPIKERPIWPLSGGPSRRKLLAPTDTLAPGTLAPVN
ncbi:MAG TPA: hypothetical protein VGQ35_04860 [Dongiaceae bacterium]|jgi:hypothetical protein|nr:hypothetical protein [Dongiaceae bacterium]